MGTRARASGRLVWAGRGRSHSDTDPEARAFLPVSLVTLFGLIGVALGYITRSTVAAVVGAVGWVLFIELAVLTASPPTWPIG